MHDHEFEKQVHDKMEELRVSPSGTVWEQVQRRLQQKDRRRRFLWLPLFFAVLFAGGYFSFRFFSSPMPDHRTGSGSLSGNPTSLVAPRVAQKAPVHPTPAPSSHLQNVTTPSLTPIPSTLPASLPAPGKLAHRPVKSAANSAFTSETFSGQTGPVKQERSFTKTEKKTAQTDAGVPEKDGLAAPVKADSGAALLLGASSLQNSLSEKDPAAAKPDLSLAGRELVITSVQMPLNERTALLKIRLPARKKFECGIVLQGGVTAINNGNFNKLFSARAADLIYFSPAANLVSNGTVPQVPSGVKPGTGFSAGFFVRKKLRSRLAVSAGIRYTLFTTSIEVGKQVDSVQQVAPGQAVNLFYRLGSNLQYTPYINRYHFLELPIALEVQLNRGRRLPLIWEAGFSLSQLVSGNALHYSSSLNGYYKDNSLFNRTQLSLSAGLQAQILSGTSHPLRIGPQIQYGITRLLPPAGSNNLHLLQYGGKISMIVW